MVIMENYIPPQDRLNELWMELDRCHLSYLELEESPEKLEQRNKLEEIIYEFLCIAPHRHKFYYPKTEEVLQRSASRKKDFSAYKASTGFAAIQLYAGNLLSQPWRKEYRTIKTYCGFYKHQVEANLVEAEILFEAMGYTRDRDGILVLNGPICPDRVSAVSRDCLIAYVECQILKIIWEELSSACMNTTWIEVLEYRRGHICSPEQAVKSFKYKQHQPQQYHEHSRSYSQGSNVTRHTLPAMPSAMSPVLPANHSFPPLSSQHNVGLPDAVYSNGCSTNRCPSCTQFACVPAAPASTYALYQPMLRPAYAPAHPAYYYNGYPVGLPMAAPVAAPPPLAPHYVPTAQLVEVGGPQNGSAYDAVDGPQNCCKGGVKASALAIEGVANAPVLRGKNNNELRTSDRESEKNGSHFEDWEYVYRNLESQGYTKDLGERGDILTTSLPKIPKDGRKTKSTNLDEVLNNLTVSNRPLKMNEALKKSEREKSKPIEVKKVDRQTSPDSSYDNVPVTETKKHINKLNSNHDNRLVEDTIQPKVNTASYAKTKSLPREKTSNHVEKSNHNSFDLKKVIDFVSHKKPDSNAAESPSNAGKWQCKACTFLNKPQLLICEICSRSRDAALEQPMEIGGSECSKCTLVNSKFAKVCEACGASLENSPTYI